MNSKTALPTVQNKSIAPAEQLRADLTRMMPQFKMALPSNVTPDKFLRIVLNTVVSNPDFLKCDRQSLYAAASKCAADGLFPDGREAAMIPYGNTVQYQPMIAGIFKKIRNAGEVSVLCADLVYPEDTFVYGSNSEKGRYLDHQPVLSSRGKPESVVAVFALARMQDGEVDFEVMTREEVEFTRSQSKAPNSPAWRLWWGEMARKTVVKRLAKRLPMDAESAAKKMIDRDDEENFEVELKPKSKAEQLREKLESQNIVMSPQDETQADYIEVETQTAPPKPGDFGFMEDPKMVK